MLSVIVTQFFRLAVIFQICGRQGFVSTLETNDNSSAKTFGLQNTICVVFSYEIIRHVNTFSAHSYMTIICNDMYGGNCTGMQLEYTFKYAYRISGYQNSASTAPVHFFINARIIQTVFN